MSPDEFDAELPIIRKTMRFEHQADGMTAAILRAQQMPYPLGQAQALLYRGEFLLDVGEQPNAATKDFREAGLLARQLNNWSLLAQTLHWQAQCQLHLGEYMRALDIWLQALQTAIEGEDSRAFIRGYSGIAQVCLVFGQLDISIDYQRRALNLAENVDDVGLRVDCLLALIASCYRLKFYDEVALLLTRLTAQLQLRPHLETQAEFHIYSGLVLLDHDQIDEAYEHLQLARVLAQQLGGLWCRSYVALILGRIFLRQNNAAQARASLELCLTLGEQISGFAMSQEAHELLETLCAQQGDYHGALIHLEAGHAKQLNLLQKQAEKKLLRISQKQLNQLELALRLELSRIRYTHFEA
jgi:tetratricopeptide (TPR) repeat protein